MPAGEQPGQRQALRLPVVLARLRPGRLVRLGTLEHGPALALRLAQLEAPPDSSGEPNIFLWA